MPSKNLLSLNNGWPFGDLPLECTIRFENREGRIWMVCAGCPQAIMSVSEPYDVAADPSRPEAYTVTLKILKAQVADHWLKCHADEIAYATYC